MFEFFIKGGILMYPILLCSLIAIAVFFERFIYLTIVKVRNKKFLIAAAKVQGDDKLKEINELSHKINSALSNILSAAIENLAKPEAERNVILHQVSLKEITQLEKNITLLSVIAHISPLLGLLGTVIGMIKCFMTIQAVGGQVDATMLAGGIWEALITTAAGLSVAIPTIVFYYFLESRVDNIITDMKNAVISFPEIFSKYNIGLAIPTQQRWNLKEEKE